MGEGKRNSRARNAETFSQDDPSSKQPYVYVIFYMLISGGFAAACLQTIVKGVLDPRLPWADTCARQVSETRRPTSLIEDGEKVVAPRSTTDSTEAMCAVVVSKTSCNDRNHPILRGVITPHRDFFFLQKS